MSASQGRLRSAIQRIAREDPEIRGTIDAFKDRGGFDSASTQVAGADDDRGICCDGSSSSNRNPGSDTRDPSESAKDGLDPDDPADISDNLSGVVDCATGQPICFEGSDFIPPEGWESPGLPGIDPDYETGSYFSAGITDGSVSGTRSASRSIGVTPSHACDLAWSRYPDSYSGEEPPDPECVVGDRRPCLSQPPVGATPNQVADHEKICINPDHEYIDAAIRKDKWPPDNCVNLAVKGGSIVGSKYDPENDGAYSSPRDEIELCDLETGARTLIRADTESTWKSIKSLDGDINPDTGYGYLYDTASGKKIRQISPSEFRDNTV